MTMEDNNSNALQNANESSSSNQDEEDLSQLLENLDIDKDFDIWSSFRGSMSGSQASTPRERPEKEDSEDDEGQEVVAVQEEKERKKKRDGKISGQPLDQKAASDKAETGANDAQDEAETMEIPRQTDFSTGHTDPRLLEKHDKAYWKQRLLRDDVYSHKYYRPTDAEKAELLQLENSLGLTGQQKPSSLRGLFQKRSSIQNLDERTVSVWKQLAHPDTTVSVNQKLNEPQSIVLKRGPCLWRCDTFDDPTESLDAEETNAKSERLHQAPSEVEVILLTHGLVLASIFTSQEQKVIKRQLSSAIVLSQVDYVQIGSIGDLEWQVVLRPGADKVKKAWTFTCSSPKQQRNWIKAMERVIVQHYMQIGHPPELGWEYKLVRKPGFGMAVTDQVEDKPVPTKMLSTQDYYRGYTPLHYAVRCQNINAVRKLLELGADPNKPDSEEGRTPFDYAMRDPAPTEIQELLLANGAKRTELSETDRGALFGQVAAVETKREEKRRQQEQEKEAQAAQQQMSQNMRLLQERGEKIEELGDKANELNQGAQDFASMARQLKEKSKKKSKWLPF